MLLCLRSPPGDLRPTRHGITVPVAVALLVAYVSSRCLSPFTGIGATSPPCEPGHSAVLVWLTIGTLATAVVSEILVHSLEEFGHAAGLEEFFIAAVIVAIVGNAAEHGGAVVIAHRGNTELATEIAVTSSMQVALFVAPAVALISLVMANNLTLGFRPVEIATMALAAGLAWLVTRDGRSTRPDGVLLTSAYLVVVAVYYFS